MTDAIETGRALIEQAQHALRAGKEVAVQVEGRSTAVDVREVSVGKGDHVARLVLTTRIVWHVALRSVILVATKD